MIFRRLFLRLSALTASFGSLAIADELQHPACLTDERDYFTDEVWGKVVGRSCLKCHKAGGDAEDSEFILLDPLLDGALKQNRERLTNLAKLREPKTGKSRVLLKVVGELDHGGEDVLAKGSTRYRILEDFVRRTNGEKSAPVALANAKPFFEGVRMIDDRRLLRRLTLQLGARLPEPKEFAAVQEHGLAAISLILDDLMKEEAFYDRLAEGFNDIFLTPGIDDVAENVLSYEHFNKTRHWYQKKDFSHLKDEQKRKEAGWELARHYRESIQREPMELVKYIVRNDRPFTELITADYIMVSPYSARGYGVFEEVKDRFKDIDDRFEYVPVRLKSLKGRSEKTNQESATGFYPHAGVLSTFQYLKRYPTTETNRNRLRVRMYFQHFLSIDIMQLAPRGNDAAAITAKYEVPTMQATDCVVCHKIIDPVAGVFQDFYALDGKGVYEPRAEGWFDDMFPPGHEGEALPESERWRGLPWLGERTAKDPRFAIAMVEHVWYLLNGRKALRPPEDIDHPLFASRQRTYSEQRRKIKLVAKQFAGNNFDLKGVFRALALSQFYRADGLAAVADDPARLAELDDLGVVRLLSPEQVERKLKAIFGRDWGRLNDQFNILYGGIDSKEVTERIADPSGAMGAIQRMMANEVACRQVPSDFARAPKDRLLFPGIEPDVVPSPGTEAKLREVIVHLHQRLLGRFDQSDSAEVDRTYELFAGIIEEANVRGNFEPREIYSCRVEGQGETRVEDPHYTMRAWRAVVTYLLRQHEFLYE
ncbi:DUF1592 domain-containing protein [Akkermansiaceae bacterium]|nr:DUF1592 domain-containing protein [Akkermansiaceae bacterium]MDA7888388.1 DUF1592 domain-containing protein [Akkermansiaceae bacterium]MDB4537707.1 DUF1592 domain-containing protein [Akkermansiaceae bacterium]